MQTVNTELETQLSEAKTRLVAQEIETKKTESKFQLSVFEAEKLRPALLQIKRLGLRKILP